MKKVLYYICLPFLLVLGLPVMVVNKEAWNRFGERVDAFFGVESRHTKMKNAAN